MKSTMFYEKSGDGAIFLKADLECLGCGLMSSQGQRDAAFKAYLHV